jgi:xanthine dehydrogenase molybdopterin-binding subunit B
MSTTAPPRSDLRSVGQSVARLEGHAKVTGSIEYIHHLRLPGMLYGKIHRSALPTPHRRYRSSAALALDGVHAVITIDDVLSVVPNPYYGPAFHDQPILAHHKVRHVGEPVAVALAVNQHVAEEAADLITSSTSRSMRCSTRSRPRGRRADHSRRAEAGRHVHRSEAPRRKVRHQRRARCPRPAR